jgi:hypothetical protein
MILNMIPLHPRLHPALQSARKPDLLHTLPDRSDLVALLLASSPHRHVDLRPNDIDLNLPPRLDRPLSILASLPPHAILAKRPRQVRDKVRALDADEAVVDRVSLEDVSKRAADDEGHARVEEGRRGLLARGAGAEVEAGDEDAAGAKGGRRRRESRADSGDEGGKGSVVVFHDDFSLTGGGDVVLVAEVRGG